MGSSQSTLDQAYDEKAAQLKREVARQKKKLGLIEGWVSVHNSMRHEIAGLKKRCAEQEKKIRELEKQNACQITALLTAKKGADIAAETIQQLKKQLEADQASYTCIADSVYHSVEEASGEE